MFKLYLFDLIVHDFQFDIRDIIPVYWRVKILPASCFHTLRAGSTVSSFWTERNWIEQLPYVVRSQEIGKLVGEGAKDNTAVKRQKWKGEIRRGGCGKQKGESSLVRASRPSIMG